MYLILLILSVVSFQANAWSLLGPGSYEDCVLEKLKGQDSKIYQVRKLAENSCDREFPQVREISTWQLEPWSWSVDSNLVLHVTFNRQSEYIVTSLQVQLMEKKCSEKYKDMSEAGRDFHLVEVYISEGSTQGQTAVPFEPKNKYNCARINAVYGKKRY